MSVPPWPGIDDVVEAYESALAIGNGANLAEFAPAAEHPQRMAILCELVRVDLEHCWEAGRPRRLEQYRALFPALFEQPEFVREMAYEEYRMRLQAGEAPTPAEYLSRFGVESDNWPSSPPAPPRGAATGPGSAQNHASTASGERPASGAQTVAGSGRRNVVDDASLISPEHAELVRTLDRTDPHAAERLEQALAELPVAGTEFLGFRLCGELGRGAFGRVFLARQGDLADRLVALKVSADVAGESHALARLQHTNIVPIYSVHRRGRLQAVCMPYLGATTIADTLSSLRSQATLPRSGEGLLSSLRSKRASSLVEPSAGQALLLSGVKKANNEAAQPSGAVAECEAAADEIHSPELEQLRGLGYVPAVLWVAARVADGLAHAHERGILHRDLKPANILFADDGEPVLLDFNLALDTRKGVGAAVALVGGTLPYMAPEHLRAFQEGSTDVDARSDVYALGVILYELLTGAHPFPIRKGSVDDILPQMIAERSGPIPDPRRANPAVSAAVASIVRHCLEPDPARRYQTARELQEDLKRQIDNLPLRHAPEPSLSERVGKWARRHPRLTSATTVGIAALCLLAGVSAAFFARQGNLKRLEAGESFRAVTDDVRQAEVLLSVRDADPRQLEEGIALCRKAAARFGVLADPHWQTSSRIALLPRAERDVLRQEMGWLLFLWARAVGWQADATADNAQRDERLEFALRLNKLGQAGFADPSPPRAFWVQRADLEERAGRADEARRLRERVQTAPAETPRERLLMMTDRIGLMKRQEALAFLREAAWSDPQNFATWLRLGNLYVELGKATGQTSYLDEADHCYGVGITLRPDLYWAYRNRGLLYLDLKNFARAQSDFTHVIALRPDMADAYMNRALARLGLNDMQGAVNDLTHALESKDAPTQALYLRANARARLGDQEGAARDRAEHLKRVPNDAVSWTVRGMAKLAKDPKGALADFDAALALSPGYDKALQNKAHVLSERLGRLDDAVRVLNRAVALHPNYVKARIGRGVLLARLGQREKALDDAHAALAIDDSALTVYQAACVYALTSKEHPHDRAEALRLIAQAVRQDGAWLATAQQDPDLAPLHAQPEFKNLLQALQVVVRTDKPR